MADVDKKVDKYLMYMKNVLHEDNESDAAECRGRESFLGGKENEPRVHLLAPNQT